MKKMARDIFEKSPKNRSYEQIVWNLLRSLEFRTPFFLSDLEFLMVYVEWL